MGGLNRLLKLREEHGKQVTAVGTAAMARNGQEFVMASKYRRLRSSLAEFDLFSALMAFFFGTQMELKPIPVKVRRRR